MPHINADIPGFDCLVRRHFLTGNVNDAAFVKARAFGIASLPGRALGFHVLDEFGAAIWRLPAHALALKLDAPATPLDHLQLWDCYSLDVGVLAFEHLRERLCQVVLKDKSKHLGNYMFTVDWGEGDARGAGDSGHKCAHVIALHNGCIAVQPNNRILWADPATITKPFDVVPEYKTNPHVWTCESATRWATEDSDRMFYGVTTGISLVCGHPGCRHESTKFSSSEESVLRREAAAIGWAIGRSGGVAYCPMHAEDAKTSWPPPAPAVIPGLEDVWRSEDDVFTLVSNALSHGSAVVWTASNGYNYPGSYFSGALAFVRRPEARAGDIWEHTTRGAKWTIQAEGFFNAETFGEHNADHAWRLVSRAPRPAATSAEEKSP